jgi:hypothetical protein
MEEITASDRWNGLAIQPQDDENDVMIYLHLEHILLT